jgi:hypothetical protein
VTDTARLLADLVRESAEGVRRAEREMLDGVHDLERALDDPPESLVDEADVDRFLVERFPDPERPPRTFVAPGRVYPPAAAETFRDLGVDVDAYRGTARFTLPFRDETVARRSVDPETLVAETGAHVDAREWDAAERSVPVLTDRLVKRVRRAVAFELGCDRREALRRVVERGVPSAVTETMDVTLKVAFDEDLTATVPNYHEADVGLQPAAIGSLSARLRFEREG